MEIQPLFATKLVFDVKYHLEHNDAELIILNSDTVLPDFGKSTNGYLWRIYYHDNVLCFDSCHGLTDGRGLTRFTATILEEYFGLPQTYVPEPDIDAFRTFYDKSVKPFGIKDLCL